MPKYLALQMATIIDFSFNYREFSKEQVDIRLIFYENDVVNDKDWASRQ